MGHVIMNAWWVIGKYGLRLNLGKAYRRFKLFFPLIVLVYIAYGVMLKMVIDANPDNFVVEILSNKVLFATLTDLILLYLFIYLIVIYVFTGIRKQDKSSTELLLSTPLRSEDIVLGETIAMLPIYLLFMPTILIPIFIFGYFKAGVGLWGLAVIFFSQALMFILAIGIGAIILALIQSSIQRLKVGKYFRLISSFIFAVLYLSIYGMKYWLSTAQSVTQSKLFSSLPTSLAGNVIFSKIMNIPSSPSVLVSICLLVLWIVVVYRVGINIAGRAYSLEKELASARVVIKKEGALLRIVRRILPSSQEEQIITHFKVFFRDSNNFSSSIYLLILGYFMTTFLVWNSRNEVESIVRFYTMEMSITPIFVSIFVLSMFYLSRDALWIWKKAPGGADKFLKSKWLQTFILSFVFLPVPFITGFVVGTDKISFGIMASTALWLLMMNAFSVSYAIFVNVLNPSKQIRGARYGINSIICSFTLIIILMGGMGIMMHFGMIFSDYTFTSHLLSGVFMGIILNVIGLIFMLVARKRIDIIMD